MPSSFLVPNLGLGLGLDHLDLGQVIVLNRRMVWFHVQQNTMWQ